MTKAPYLLFESPTSDRPFVDYDYPADLRNWNHIAIVGEAPGKEEARLGHPFVGRSGKLLDEMLVKAKIERRQSLVANVFRYQPPANNVSHFFSSRKAAKEAGRELDENLGPFGNARCLKEYTNEISHLSSILQKMAPHVIIALGRTPFWALTGENELLKKVGQRFDCRLAPNIPVIPTYHPSFILRGNWGLQEEWVRHLIFAAAQ